MRRAADEHRLYLRSFDEREQAVLSGHEIAGELVTESDERARVGVYLNDTTGAKMSYYLRSDVRVRPTSCTSQVQTLTGQARFESVAPADAASSLPHYVTGGGDYGIPPGEQLVAVRIYGPDGGEVGEVSLNGRPVKDVSIVVHGDRPVATVYVLLKPQQVIDMTWDMKSGAGQTGPVSVSVTPGITAGSSSRVVDGAC
jgi:hypothetical protein